MNEDRAIDLLALIAQRAPDSDATQSALAEIRAKNPEYKWTDPELVAQQPRWFQLPTKQAAPQEMHANLEENLGRTLTALRSEYRDRLTGRESFWAEVQSVCLSVKEYPDDGLRLLTALCDSVDANTAGADRAIAGAVLDAWVDPSVAIENYEPVAGLLQRLAEAGGQYWSTDANFTAYSGVDWLTRSINDWTGKSVRVWTRLPQAAADDDNSQISNVLGIMQDGLTYLLELSEFSGQLATAMIANSTNWLFAIAPEWTLKTILPLFHSSQRIERAVCAWNGYLYSPAANQKLLSAGLLEHYLTLLPRITTRPEPLSQLRDGIFDFQREFNRHLAQIALFSGINPQEHGWLAHYVAAAPTDWRVTWVQEISSHLEEMTVAARGAQWESWIRDFLADRTAGRPRTLDTNEASEITEWARHFDAEFPEFVEIIRSWPGIPLSRLSRLAYSIAKMRDEPNDFDSTTVDVAERHPEATAKLLTHLLSSSNKPGLRQHGDTYTITQAAGRIRDLASEAEWRALEQQLMRLGIGPSQPQS